MYQHCNKTVGNLRQKKKNNNKKKPCLVFKNILLDHRLESYTQQILSESFGGLVRYNDWIFKDDWGEEGGGKTGPMSNFLSRVFGKSLTIPLPYKHYIKAATWEYLVIYFLSFFS